MRRANPYQKLQRNPVYVTAKGKAELQAELNDLLTVQRPAIAAAILAAREDGDLKENGAYHDAKDRQGLMEGRIRDIQDKLLRSQVFDPPAASDAIGLGSTVTIVGVDGAEESYTIVGSTESKVGAGRISNESPLGRALLGRKVGEQAQVKAPRGDMAFTVRAIS